MERPAGIDALRNLPFDEVVLPFDTAADKLFNRTVFNIGKNIEEFKMKLEEAGELDEETAVTLTDHKNTLLARLGRGGYSATESEIGKFYSTWKKPYSEFMDNFVDKGINTIFNRRPYKRNPGLNCMGFTLDYLDLINPEIASYDDGVLLFIESQRKSGLRTFLVGAMVDDAYHLRTQSMNTIDFVMGKEDVIKFTSSYLSQISGKEKLEFAEGYMITLSEMHLSSTGSSLN